MLRPNASFLRLIVGLWAGLVSVSGLAQFATVINVPPDMAPASIGSNTQLNLSEGGSLGHSFDAGAINGTSTNVEVNVLGGSVGNGFDAFRGSTVNISAGAVGTSFDAENGSVVNISGGLVGTEFEAFSGSTVNISSGLVGNFFQAHLGSMITLSGGAFGHHFDALTGSTLRIIGNEFRLDGVPIAGLGTPGDTLPFDLPVGGTLTGVLSDGLAFIFSGLEGDDLAAGTLTLQAAELPPMTPGVFTASSSPLPLGVRAGQKLIVDAGYAVAANYTAAPSSTVEVQTGGTVGANFEAVGAVLNIVGGFVGTDSDAAAGAVVNLSSGTISTSFDALAGSVVNIHGGLVGDNFDAKDGSLMNVFGGNLGTVTAFGGSVVNIAGGSITDVVAYDGGTVNMSDGAVGQFFHAHNGSTVNVAGGAVGDFFTAHGGSVMNFSGGTIGDDLGADSGSNLNVFGTQFMLAGRDITSSLSEDVPFIVNDRNVTLTGFLADGSPFEFQLNTTDQLGADFFDLGTQLTITFVAGIPGDFNVDGVVNAADYTVWRNNVGTIVAVRGNDGDGNYDGRVTPADYYVWKKHFGNVAGGLGANFDERFPANVPEPGTLALLALAGVLASARWRPRQLRRV
jgi:hypothetical protein